MEARRRHVAAQQGGAVVDALAQEGADFWELRLEFRRHHRAFDEAEGRQRAVGAGQGEHGGGVRCGDAGFMRRCEEMALQGVRIDRDRAEGGGPDRAGEGFGAAGTAVVPGLGGAAGHGRGQRAGRYTRNK